MTAYFKSIWSTRFFLFSLIKYDLNTRYQRSILGLGWSLIQPIGMTIVLCTVFHRLFGVDIRDYGPFLLAGIAFWTYFTNSVLTGCQCFFQAEPYMRQYPAPAAIYPMRATLGAMFHFLMALGIVLMLTWVMKGIGNLQTIPILLPALVLFVIFGWSVATLAALANTHFPDAQHLVDLGMQALFYLTPIIYPPDMLNARGLGWLVQYNPIASMLELVRAPILYAQLPSTTAVYTALIMTGTAFGLASYCLTKMQNQLVFKL